MKKTITYQAQDHTIDVQKADHSITVTFKDQTFTFQKRMTHDGWILENNHQTFKTTLVQSQADVHTVHVNGAAIELMHTDPYALQNAGSGAGAQGDIKAVMPGRVVKILVQEGQDVTQGQPVLVLEAMKMENEIKAPVDGKVEKICVAESASVESGAMLVNIQPI